MTRKGPGRIFIVAGEDSGDAHGAELIEALLDKNPDLEIEGLGGPRMAAAGCRLRLNLVEHAVMGLLRVLPKIPFFWRLMRETTRYVVEEEFDLVVPIDYPGFNMRLSRRLKKRGVPVCYYVSPQNWAWRSTPVSRIKRSVDRMMVLFPFETTLYEENDVPVSYVGHPLWDDIEATELDSSWMADHRPDEGRLIGILPGSRRQEIRRNLPVMLRAARMIRAGESTPPAFIIPCPAEKQKALIESMLGAFTDFQPPVAIGRFREVAAMADLALVTSGTATLELLYRATPMIISYRVSWWAALLARLILRIPHIGLPNILAGREIVPEHLTCRDHSEAMAREGQAFLNEDRERIKSELTDLKERVCEPGASERAADAVLDMLED